MLVLLNEKSSNYLLIKTFLIFNHLPPAIFNNLTFFLCTDKPKPRPVPWL